MGKQSIQESGIKGKYSERILDFTIGPPSLIKCGYRNPNDLTHKKQIHLDPISYPSVRRICRVQAERKLVFSTVPG